MTTIKRSTTPVDPSMYARLCTAQAKRGKVNEAKCKALRRVEGISRQA